MREVIITLGTIVFFFLFTSIWGFYISIRPPKIISQITPKDLGLDYENITFATEDGIKLSGWYIPSKTLPDSTNQPTGKNKAKKNKAIILLHGYPADKGDILPALSFLNKKYNIFLFDFRYLGQSEGKYTTAGAKESEDLLAAVKFLKSRDIEEFGIWGFSLGGAVALTAAPKIPEVRAIVSESSYASLDLMALELYRIPILKYPLAHLTGFWSKIFLGIDLKKVSPAESAKGLEIPILVIHSKNDEVIPFKNALLIQEALKNKSKAEFWFQENLIHGQLNEEYQKRIEGFFDENL